MLLKSSTSGHHKIIWITIVAVLIIGVAALYLWSRLSSQDISLWAQVSPQTVTVGMPFTVTVNLSNNSSNDLGDVNFLLDLPDSVRPINVGSYVNTKSVGNISRGGFHQETFQLVALPLEGNSERTFNVTASYTVGSITAHFDKTAKVDINVQNLPLTLELTTPDKVFSGEEFEVTAAYGRDASSSVTSDLPLLALRFDYPDTFVLTSAEPQTTGAGGNIWPVAAMKGGDVGKIVVRGKVSLPDQAVFNITANLVASILGNNYVVLSKSAQISVSPSPLAFNVSVGDGSRTIFQPGETLNYILSYKNNTAVALQGIVIKASLSGEMLDLGSLKANGARFSSYGNTLTWDASSIPVLASLAAGADGNVTFSVNLKNDYPIRRLNDKNFSVKVNAKIESPTVPYLIAAENTVNTSALTVKIAGRLVVEASGYFRDASAGWINNGPWPPKVGAPTDYTIHWKLINYSTDVTGVEVRAKLADNVKLTGSVKANTSAVPQFDSSSGEIVWNVGQLPATSGILTDAPEAIFQIEATPQVSDIGKYMNLILPAGVKAQDSFTGLQLTAGTDALSTRLSSDPTVGPNDGLVVN
jgi:hypothetical protein